EQPERQPLRDRHEPGSAPAAPGQSERLRESGEDDKGSLPACRARMTHTKSEAIFEQAQKRIPGGVNSPVRAYRSVGGRPPFIARGQGSRIWDVDGNEYIDYVGSWGPLLLGHRHPEILTALEGALEIGTSFGAPTVQEVELAEAICDAVPSI